MNVVLGHDSELVELYWAGDNLSEWDVFCYESCPWCRIDRVTCWPAFQIATTVPRMYHILLKEFANCYLYFLSYSCMLSLSIHVKNEHILVIIIVIIVKYLSSFNYYIEYISYQYNIRSLLSEIEIYNPTFSMKHETNIIKHKCYKFISTDIIYKNANLVTL